VARTVFGARSRPRADHSSGISPRSRIAASMASARPRAFSAFSRSSRRTASVLGLGDSGLGDLDFGVGQVQDGAQLRQQRAGVGCACTCLPFDVDGRHLGARATAPSLPRPPSGNPLRGSDRSALLRGSAYAPKVHGAKKGESNAQKDEREETAAAICTFGRPMVLLTMSASPWGMRWSASCMRWGRGHRGQAR
jgi:hypothetical protein